MDLCILAPHVHAEPFYLDERLRSIRVKFGY